MKNNNTPNNIRNVLQRHRKVVVLSVVSIALAVYMFPLDSLLSNQATAQSERRNNPYGNVNQGPPSDTPGKGPPASSPGGGQGPPEDRGPPAPRGGGGGGPPRP